MRDCIEQNVVGIASPLANGAFDVSTGAEDDPAGDVVFTVVVAFGRDEDEARSNLARRSRPGAILTEEQEAAWTEAKGDVAYAGFGPIVRRGAKVPDLAARAAKVEDYVRTAVERCLEQNVRSSADQS